MTTPQAKSVEEVLKDKARLGAEFEQYQRLVTVMFTDIAGSTKYFDTHGDLEGMHMVTDVLSTLQPQVVKHKGTVVKTIGDAIMAYFENPVDAVRCSMQMLRALIELNKRRPQGKDVHVRVALNLGVGLVKDNDVFGDVVNVCSRIEHHTEANRIGVSPSVVEAISKEKDIAVRKIGEVALRGKAAQMDLYEVLWREGEKVKEEAPVKMSGEQLALATGTQLGLADDVRAAIAQALKGKAPTGKVQAAERKFTLVQVLPDRSLGQRFPLKEQSVVVGREQAPIAFADDPLMSRQHAVFTSLGGALYVEDLGSANGVFVRIRHPLEIDHGDIVLLGRQMFRFQLMGQALPGEAKEDEKGKKPAKKAGRETLVAKFEPKDVVKATGTLPVPTDAPLQGELVRLVRGGVEEKHFPLYRGENSFGRTKGNYTFTEDPYLSRLHARLILHAPRCVLEDLNSTNGTFVRIRERQILDVDDTVLVGSQFLRVLGEPA